MKRREAEKSIEGIASKAVTPLPIMLMMRKAMVARRVAPSVSESEPMVCVS